MIVREYDGNSDTVKSTWGGVTALTIQSNGAISLQCPVIGSTGKMIVQLDPSSNKITIERAYNEE